MAGEAYLRDRRPAQEALMRPSAKEKGGRGRVPPGRGPLRRQKKRRP